MARLKRKSSHNSLLGAILFILGVVPLIYYFNYNQLSKPPTSVSLQLSSTSLPQNSHYEFTLRFNDTSDIFAFYLWRDILIGHKGNQTLCKVPNKYQPIVNAYCDAYSWINCSYIPCTLVYISEEYTTNIECLRGGKPAVGVIPDWICKQNPALELLDNPYRKPSLITESYTKLTTELFGQALAPYHDGETSKWGLYLEGESIAYYPSVYTERRVLSLFDITVGYDRRIFDLMRDTHLTAYVDPIANRHNQRLTIDEVFSGKVSGRAPILWLNGNCNAISNRTGYMLELMKYIQIDALGRCGNPTWNDTADTSDMSLLAKKKMKLCSQYLFTIAMENSLEYDYVTEKLWQPLAAGSIPIYLGAPNIDDWLPCENYSCIIHLRDFKNMEDVANLIRKILDDKTLYVKYHQWREQKVLRPKFQKMLNYLEEANRYSIECLICDMTHRRDHGTTRRTLMSVKNQFTDPFPSLM